MPLTDKGKKILSNMKDEYGPDKGESVFYASINAGKVKGAELKKTGLNVHRGVHRKPAVR